jgi:hypothetical protein
MMYRVFAITILIGCTDPSREIAALAVVKTGVQSSVASLVTARRAGNHFTRVKPAGAFLLPTSNP